MLKSRPWKGVYRSDSDSLLDDFYIPALKLSASYSRAVGFFSAAMLSYAAQGISALIQNGGSMRLIFGGEIDEDDARAMNDGYEMRQLSARLGKKILHELSNVADALVNQRLTALAWLIANGQLDVKFALKRRGMYHEKIGIFSDASGDQVVFQGSANETVHALLPDFNFESINVFPTWRQELQDHFAPYINGFERLWGNKTPNTVVLDFPDAAREELVKVAIRNKRPPSIDVEIDLWERLAKKGRTEESEPDRYKPSLPVSYKGAEFEIRDHQRAALNAWRGHECRGILAMATGSGKTLTAIYGAIKLYERLKRLFLVIAVPYQSLADQWIDELSQFQIAAIPCYDVASIWSDRLSQAVSLFEVGASRFVACVVVNRTLQSEGFQQRLARVPGTTILFIGDECHHHSASGLADSLPKHAQLRLGLSATPKHYFDDSKTAKLISYYGDVVFEFSLAEALKQGVLTPYKYFVHTVELTTSEAEQYVALSKAISRIAADQSESDLEGKDDGDLQLLLFRRARLLGNAQGKIDRLRQLTRKDSPSPFTLYYCGDGSVESDDEWITRQVDQVSQLLAEQGWKISHFTSRERRDARTSILDNFRIGVIDGLVAIRCLDEGIDVPDCRVAYILASSRNPKQFVQRRGRILRRAPGKTFAVVHDFLVTLPPSAETSGTDRNLIKAELARIAEFASLATNYAEVFGTLKPLLGKYDVSHYLAI